MNFSGREDIPRSYVFPMCVSNVLLPPFLPRAVLPKDDRTGFVQEQPLVLHLRPIVVVYDRVVVLSSLVDALSLTLRGWRPVPVSLEIAPKKLAAAISDLKPTLLAP